jgi:hypothetical protein
MSLDVYLEDPTATYAAEPPLYWRNITHNLGGMAGAAGLYKALWRPEEVGIDRAALLVEPLERGLEKLRDPANRPALDALLPENGWGTYEGLVAFVADYLRAARNYPLAKVRVSR